MTTYLPSEGNGRQGSAVVETIRFDNLDISEMAQHVNTIRL